jgi:excisionase family DNA binding protein
MDAEQLLTPAETAKRLGMSLDTLRRHVRDGDISYVVIGRGSKHVRRRFAPSDIARFEDRQRHTCQTPRDYGPAPTAAGKSASNIKAARTTSSSRRATGAKLFELATRRSIGSRPNTDPLAPAPRRK